MSSRAGLASPAPPDTAYNPDNLSSKNISSCEWICPQSWRCPVHFFVISIMARYSIFRRLSSEGNTVLDFVTFLSCRLNPSMAVSYTHLDVYKRQAQFRLELFQLKHRLSTPSPAFYHIILQNGTQSVPFLYCSRWLLLWRDLRWRISADSIRRRRSFSFHQIPYSPAYCCRIRVPDVYKRQVQKKRQRDIFLYSENGNQIIKLIDQTNLTPAEDRQLLFSLRVYVAVV